MKPAQYTVCFAKHVEIKYNNGHLWYFIFIVPCVITFYEITNRCNCTQWILFLCLVHSTCFGLHTRPSSVVQCSTVSTATGTNHSIGTDRHSYFLPVWTGTQLHTVASVGYFIECYDARNSKYKIRRILDWLPINHKSNERNHTKYQGISMLSCA